MFLERNSVVSSADFGMTFMANFGGELTKEQQAKAGSKYPGKYGSIALGAYNGGGYHAIEQNNDKTLEARLSCRPMPETLPGFQVSYTGVTGKGNTKAAPDWQMNALFLSLVEPHVTATAMYYDGVGDFKGDAVDSAGGSLDQSGYSLFCELKPVRMFSLIGRYDNFDTDGGANVQRIVAGIARNLSKNAHVLIDYDIASENDFEDTIESVGQITFQIKY